MNSITDVMGSDRLSLARSTWWMKEEVGRGGVLLIVGVHACSFMQFLCRGVLVFASPLCVCLCAEKGEWVCLWLLTGELLTGNNNYLMTAGHIQHLVGQPFSLQLLILVGNRKYFGINISHTSLVYFSVFCFSFFCSFHMISRVSALI